MDHVESTDQTEMDPPPPEKLTRAMLRERLRAEWHWLHKLSHTAEYLGEPEAAQWIRRSANLLHDATDAIDTSAESK